MKLLRSVFLGVLLTVSTASAQEEMTKQIMVEGVRANLAAFETVKLAADGSPASFTIQLGATTSSYRDRVIFDGLRITAPQDVKDKDFVWYFNVPNQWGQWFIVPVEGDFDEGFRDWKTADKLYRDLDKPKEKGRTRALQTLDGDYFEPGRDYILWFRRVEEGAGELRGALAFASLPKDGDEWDHESIEEALRLKAAPAPVQAEELDSRGARILLDAEFFHSSEAENRIDQVFTDLRQTRWLKGGFFITMEISCPPCRKSPSFAKILERHGAPDFVLSSDEEIQVRKHAGGDKPDDDEATITHFYDYFGFEVAKGDPSQKVLRVTTQASNFANLRPPDDKAFYGRVPMKNLVVFHDKRKEVGRAYYFLEGSKMPLFIQEPPAGRYQSGGEVLEYQGQGKWLWLTFNEGKVVRRIPFEKHQMHGRAEGFHKDDTPAFTAEYKEGQLDGEVIEYDQNGAIIERRTFLKGKPTRDPTGN